VATPKPAPVSRGRRWYETSERRLRISRVRLIISIPTLILLITLGVNFIAYQRLLGTAAREKNPEVSLRIELVAANQLQSALVMSLLAGALGLVVAFQIVRPIRELTQTAHRLVHGDLSGRMRMPELGEFADLGTTFNRMVDHLQRIFRERNRILEGAEGASVVWLDLDGSIRSMDATNVALFGRRVVDMIGKPLAEVIPDRPENREVRGILHREMTISQSRRPSSYIVEAQLDPEAPPLLTGLTLALMRDDHGEPSGYLMTLRNLDALRSFHDQMMRADRLAALGTFAAGMAHEVRNPLASIKGMVQLMGEIGEASDLKVYVDRIVQEIARLERLLSEMMNFAHPEQTTPESVDLLRLVRESLEVAMSHCDPRASNIRIHTDLQALPPCVVEPRKIHQALVNIMINAFEATPAGGEVVIHTENRRDQPYEIRPLVISVTNTGSRIPAEEAERIFEPFHTTKPNGTGLGLPIAYQIITTHRGSLDMVQSDKAVTFRICLPEFPLGQ